MKDFTYENAVILSNACTIFALLGITVEDVNALAPDAINFLNSGEQKLFEIKISIPEFSTLTPKDFSNIGIANIEVTDDNIDEINSQQGKIDIFKSYMIDFWKSIECGGLFSDDDYLNAVRFLCKIRKGETWTKKNIDHVVEMINSDVSGNIIASIFKSDEEYDEV